ncbi:Peptide chain release factor 1, partial [Termitomyces sp. T112]
QNENEGGGIKDAIVEVKGDGAYDVLRWESGVHRVQRVPATEASGRVHTSTVAVIVLPLVEESDTTEELFSMDDVKVEVMRARGWVQQHVNRTESAVRLTHIPTGVTVSMQDERSQHQNRRRAFTILRSRLMDIKLTREIAERRATRQSLVRTADRSEKIRTYNFAQERVTDHRIGLTLKNLSSVLEGDGLQDFIYELQKDHDESVLEDMLNAE